MFSSEIHWCGLFLPLRKQVQFKTVMKNKPTAKLLKLQGELKQYLPSLVKAAEIIQDQEVSNYPIFVVHQQTVDIGINIVDKEKAQGNWSVNASTLEEFVTKQILSPEKVEDFKTLYRSHEGELCLFVLSELGANFIFLPQPAEGSDH